MIEPTTEYPFLSILFAGGWMMIPLAICSILALTLIIERFFFGPTRNRIISKEFMQTIASLIQQNKLEQAIGHCKAQKNSLSRVILSMLENEDKSKEEIIEIAEMTGREETQSLKKFLGILGTISAVTPLMGLLGTVFGMIETFTAITEYGIGEASVLSSGISQALITTATGLTIAIPTFIFYRFFLHRTEDTISAIEKNTHQMLIYLLALKDAPKESIKGFATK